MPEKQNIGPRLQVALDNAGLTQRQLAHLLEVSAVAVTHWRFGRAMPQPHRLKQIARICGVSEQWLLTGMSEMDPETRKSLKRVLKLPAEERQKIMSLLETLPAGRGEG